MIAVAICSNCRKETDYIFWQREYPNISLCRECWSLPISPEKLVRDDLARTIVLARRTSRQLARDVLAEFKGTGIPLNPKRRGKQT